LLLPASAVHVYCCRHNKNIQRYSIYSILLPICTAAKAAETRYTLPPSKIKNEVYPEDEESMFL
jgi:hypothetical protein